MPTHNRFEYTQKAIQRLLENQNEEFELYLWDNASNDDTAEYLMSLNDPRIKEVYISKTNEGQTGAMNWAWSRTSTELVGKIDNDCLATPGWTYKFALAHKDIPMLGTLAMWHFPHKEFNEKLAEKKIQTFGSHQIFRHPWTCGSGFIIKRKVFLKMGNWISGSHVGTTDYFLKMARAGYINGWYYPLVLQEHMDDPESEYSFFHTKQFDMAYSNSYGYNYAGIRNMQKYLEARKQIIDNLMTAPFDVRYYHPMRQRFRRIINYIRKM
jgi:glycosyltransferase involved in cell wall biosynthesis